MASAILKLDTRYELKEGKYPLKIAITHKGGYALISTGIQLKPDQFVNGEIIGVRGYVSFNETAQTMLFHAKKLLLDYKLSGRLNKISAKELKNAISKKIENIEEEQKPCLFKDHMEKFVSDKQKERTKEIYLETLKKISSYTDIDNLYFEDINYAWLKKFESFMASTCSINTRAIHLRNIRAIFNDAIDMDIISQNLYPFRKFKIKKERTRKRNLSVEELIKLRDYPCEPHQEKYRDIFMLVFYLIGINMVDLLHLKEIRNGRIEYRRAKTGRLYSIEVLPEAEAIFNKYKGEKYLLNIMDTYNNYKDFTKRMNDNLQLIGEVEIGKQGKKTVTPIFPDLTTYWARHTWATIASDLDIPEKTISASLGHGGNSVTDVYIDFDRKKIDKANRDVIAFVNNNNLLD